MTTLADRPNAALLVIDDQKDVVGAAYNRDQVIANIATLVEKARASGTPVVALRRGAAPEVVEHGRTGFVCDTAAEMARLIPDVSDLDPTVCRQEVFVV